MICECNLNEINFLLNLKYEINNQNNSIHQMVLSMYSQHSGDTQSLRYNNDHSNISYTLLENILNNNKRSLVSIEYDLIRICKHKIIEDYIESGIDKPLKKIQYCEICELNMSDV